MKQAKAPEEPARRLFPCSRPPGRSRSLRWTALLVLVLLAAAARAPGEPAKWELVWSDEFDGDELDFAK